MGDVGLVLFRSPIHGDSTRIHAAALLGGGGAVWHVGSGGRAIERRGGVVSAAASVGVCGGWNCGWRTLRMWFSTSRKK